MDQNLSRIFFASWKSILNGNHGNQGNQGNLGRVFWMAIMAIWAILEEYSEWQSWQPRQSWKSILEGNGMRMEVAVTYKGLLRPITGIKRGLALT